MVGLCSVTPYGLYSSFAVTPGIFTAQAQAGKEDDMADMRRGRHSVRTVTRKSLAKT